MDFTKIQIEKAKNCKTVEELKELAKSERLNLTDAEAEEYFKQTRAGELSDEDLSAVAGGKGWKFVDEKNFDNRTCPFCGAKLNIKKTWYKKSDDWKTECSPNVCSCGAKILHASGTCNFNFVKNGESRLIW